MSEATVSLGAAMAEAARFERLFRPAYRRWLTCGWPRRREKNGPLCLTHLIVPGRGESRRGNPAWDRAVELVCDGKLLTVEGYPAPDAQTVMHRVAAQPRGEGFSMWTHEIVLATDDSWGPTAARLTGPPGYWRMLAWRLRLAGALTIHQGGVCVIDRSGASERLVPLPCPTEKQFFRLARTDWREPAGRFARPAAGDDPSGNWAAGMLEEWYPAGVKAYADPLRQAHLFDSSRAVDPRFVGGDRGKWRHS